MAKAIFVQNFTLVSKFYGCTQAEVEEMKEAARRDMGSAETCFAALAAEAKEAGFTLDRAGAVAVEVHRQIKSK